MSRLPRPVARRIDRLAFRAHLFHRWAHHPLCARYAAEVFRVGRRTRLCRGCTLALSGLLAGIVAGPAAPPLSATLLAVAAPALALGAIGLFLWRAPKAVTRFLPGLALAALVSGGASRLDLAGAFATLAGLGAIVGVALAYRRRGPDRSACSGCPEAPAGPSCSGLRPIAARERAFARLAGRWISRAQAS